MSKSEVKEAVLKHDDFVKFGREFEGIGESRFLNCCRNPLSARHSYKYIPERGL